MSIIRRLSLLRSAAAPLSLSFAFAMGSLLGVAAHAGPAPQDPCTAKKFEFAQVEKACKEGGRKAAKDLMKGVVKKAKAAGKDIKCNACHTSLNTFELKPNAVADLKPLL